MFLKRACNPAASASFVFDKVIKASALIGTKVVAIPMPNITFGKIMLSNDEVLFSLENINTAVAIITSPIAESNLFSTLSATLPITKSPIKHDIARGKTATPAKNGGYPRIFCTN